MIPSVSLVVTMEQTPIIETSKIANTIFKHVSRSHMSTGNTVKERDRKARIKQSKQQQRLAKQEFPSNNRLQWKWWTTESFKAATRRISCRFQEIPSVCTVVLSSKLQTGCAGAGLSSSHLAFYLWDKENLKSMKNKRWGSVCKDELWTHMYPNIRATNSIKQIWRDLNGNMNPNTMIVGNFDNGQVMRAISYESAELNSTLYMLQIHANHEMQNVRASPRCLPGKSTWQRDKAQWLLNTDIVLKLLLTRSRYSRIHAEKILSTV